MAQERPDANANSQAIEEITARLRSAIESGDQAAVRAARADLLAMPDQQLAKPMLEAVARQQRIEDLWRAVHIESFKPARFEVLRELVSKLPKDHPFVERLRTISNEVREHLVRLMQSVNPEDWSKGTDLLQEAALWDADAKACEEFAQKVIPKFKATISTAFANSRGSDFDGLSADKQHERLNRLSAMIEVGELLAPYDRKLQEILDYYRNPPQPKQRERQPPAPPRPPKKRDTPMPDDPSRYLITGPVQPMVSGEGPIRGWGRELYGVSGSVTNQGKRTIEDVILKVGVRFQGFQRTYLVTVGTLKPGQTRTWEKYIGSQSLPNNKDPITPVVVANARFAESE